MLPMRRAKIKRAGKSERGAENAAIAGADFMLSIVEAHHTRGNGNVIKMDSGLKAQQELTKIEEQITRLEALEGQNAETLRQIRQLHERVSGLRREISSHLNAWERPELARHPQRPYTLDYVERIFSDWGEIHGDAGLRHDPAHDCGMARLHCRGRSRVDDGKLGLLGDFAGGLRVDHVARSQQERSGGGGHEDHGERFKRTGLH